MLVKCVLYSRNNGYAISTPTRDQYRGDGIGVYLSSLKLVLSLSCYLFHNVGDAVALLLGHWTCTFVLVIIF